MLFPNTTCISFKQDASVDAKRDLAHFFVPHRRICHYVHDKIICDISEKFVCTGLRLARRADERE